MSNCEQSVEQEETRESDAIFLPYFKEKLEGYLYLQKFCQKVEHNKDYLATMPTLLPTLLQYGEMSQYR
jgi:hypothetical protein